jgi:heme/copper-type cytochrome/quinol oxidase subunit 2
LRLRTNRRCRLRDFESKQLTRYSHDWSRNEIIKVKKGDRVKLVITARDREHGFKLAAFHIDRRLPNGEAVPFQRSVFCGMGHKIMTGQLIVE